MLLTNYKRRREKMTDKVNEKSAKVILQIIDEIKSLESDLGDNIVDDFKNNHAAEFENFTDEKIRVFRKHGKKLIKLGDSVYLPFSVSRLIKNPALNPLESIYHIYTECEIWLRLYSPDLVETDSKAQC